MPAAGSLKQIPVAKNDTEADIGVDIELEVDVDIDG